MWRLYFAEQELAEWLLHVFGEHHCLSDNVQLLDCKPFGVGEGRGRKEGMKIFVVTSGGFETFYSGLQGGMNFLWIIYIYPLPQGSRYFLTSI